jgi:hypothetical protein
MPSTLACSADSVTLVPLDQPEAVRFCNLTDSSKGDVDRAYTRRVCAADFFSALVFFSSSCEADRRSSTFSHSGCSTKTGSSGLSPVIFLSSSKVLRSSSS